MLIHQIFPLAITFRESVVDWMNRFEMPLADNYVLWKTIGLVGVIIFGSRTFVQWIYSEKHKEVKIPVIFWWLSVVGTIICLSYALRQKDSVFILMYTANMIPYVRNLMLVSAKRKRDAAHGFEVLPTAASSTSDSTLVE